MHFNGTINLDNNVNLDDRYIDWKVIDSSPETDLLINSEFSSWTFDGKKLKNLNSSSNWIDWGQLKANFNMIVWWRCNKRDRNCWIDEKDQDEDEDVKIGVDEERGRKASLI